MRIDPRLALPPLILLGAAGCALRARGSPPALGGGGGGVEEVAGGRFGSMTFHGDPAGDPAGTRGSAPARVVAGGSIVLIVLSDGTRMRTAAGAKWSLERPESERRAVRVDPAGYEFWLTQGKGLPLMIRTPCAVGRVKSPLFHFRVKVELDGRTRWEVLQGRLAVEDAHLRRREVPAGKRLILGPCALPHASAPREAGEGPRAAPHPAGDDPTPAPGSSSGVDGPAPPAPASPTDEPGVAKDLILIEPPPVPVMLFENLDGLLDQWGDREFQ